MSPAAAVLIGIGNPYRRDDGIGPALVARVGRLSVPGVALVCADGEPSQLMDAWAGARLAVVVDAVRSPAPVPGRMYRTALAAPYALEAGPPDGDLRAGPASTHGLGVPDAIRLAVVLDQVPRQLVVFAVEAADLGFGTGLSGPVAARLPELTLAVLAELTAG